MSVKQPSIRQLSHFKKNVVLELFGTSKKQVQHKENAEPETVRPSKRYIQQPHTPNASNILTLLNNIPDAMPLRKSSHHKNVESNDVESRNHSRNVSNRKKQITITIDEPSSYQRKVTSHYRDFKSSIQLEQPKQTSGFYTRKHSLMQMPFVSTQVPSSVKRSSSFRDLFKSSIKLG